jgi:predicted RecA/RadA family phage recombinase
MASKMNRRNGNMLHVELVGYKSASALVKGSTVKFGDHVGVADNGALANTAVDITFMFGGEHQFLFADVTGANASTASGTPVYAGANGVLTLTATGNAVGIVTETDTDVIYIQLF